MTEQEKLNALLLQYLNLAGEQVLKQEEMKRIEEELRLTPEEALERAKKLVLQRYPAQ